MLFAHSVEIATALDFLAPLGIQLIPEVPDLLVVPLFPSDSVLELL